MALKSQSTACPSLRACRLHGQGLLCQSGKRLHKNLMKNHQWDQLLKTISASVLGNILPPPPTCCEQTLAENLADGNLPCFAAAKDKNPLVQLISRILCNSNNNKKKNNGNLCSDKHFPGQNAKYIGVPIRSRRLLCPALLCQLQQLLFCLLSFPNSF